ncbi:MAG: hypothetical protein H7249_17315 [Chitinophagaceae bacterium]|nr:hypothetical protein [Oligoflexus sp.]
MRSRFSQALLISLLTGSTACVTTPSRPRRKTASEHPLEKEGQKIPSGQTTAAPGSGSAGGAAVPPASPSAADVQGLWGRTNNMAVPMNEDDLMRATQLYPTQPGSLEEAIFVVTQMRMVDKDWERRTSFQTQDLHTNQAADNTGGLSLEKTFQDLEVDLPKALRSNATLKNHDTLMLVKKLLSHTKNSETFNISVATVVKERGAEWPDVGAADLPSAKTEAAVPGIPPVSGAESITGVNGAGAAGTVPGAEASVTPAVPQVAPTSAAAPVDSNAALDLMGSDTLLIAAQKLADKRDYKAALDHVSRVKKEDPFYAQAQEKQKQYSNRAVKDLRQRAAEAFSNSAPINDTKAKSAYLKQARNYLEQALRDYPLADHLDTVRDNLEAVNHDLESIEKSGT